MEELIWKLRQISLIAPGNKIDTRKMVILEGNSWYTSFYRTWKQENRYHDIEQLTLLLQAGIFNYQAMKDYQSGKCLFLALQDSLQGLTNLRLTYCNDILASKNLRECQKLVEDFLLEKVIELEDPPFIPSPPIPIPFSFA